jgi:hypothetical protein
MTDYASIVDDIRSFLQSSDQTVTDELRGWAEAYAAACRETNQRLRRCEDFLEKGLHSEAVHFAQAEPVLLDVVATLDFPERPQWEEVSGLYGLPAAPKLMLATAEALNEAYGKIQPLQHMLRRHRLLALSRAPLPERLEVMRELATLDPGNPVWNEDIGEFEALRGRQIESDLRKAIRTDDGNVIDTLVTEVRTTTWQNNPPVGLVATAQWAAQVRQARRVQEMFRGIAHDLIASMKAGDLQKVRELHGRWHEEGLRHHLPPQDPLWAEVAPAFNWLAGEEHRASELRKQRAALIRLEEGISDKSATRSALEKLYRAVLVHDGKPDASVEEQYRKRLQVIDEAGRQRRKFVVLSVAIGALFLTLAVGYWLFESARRARIEEAAGSISGMLNAGELANARSYLDRLSEQHPDLASSPEIVAIKKRLDGASAAEQERVSRFQEAIKTAEAVPLEDAEPPALAEARSVAKTSEEESAVHRLERARAERAAGVRRKREAGFQNALATVENRVGRLGPLVASEPDAPGTHEALDKLQSDLNQLIAGNAGLSEQVRDLAKPLVARIEVMRATIAQDREQKKLIDEMSHALVAKQDLGQYCAVMQKYVNHFPTDPRGIAFERVIRERPLWEAEESWSRLIGPVKEKLFELSPDDAQILRGRVADFTGNGSQFIDADVAATCLSCLQAIAQQDEKISTSAAARLRELFSNWRYRQLWFVVADDKTYYVVQDPAPDIQQARDAGDLIKIHHISDAIGNSTTHQVMKRHITRYGRCGASRVADIVLSMPPSFADRSWDRAMCRILRELSTTPDMDPIVRLYLLRTVTKLASEGSYPLSGALDQPKRLLNDGAKDLDKAEWMVPESNLVAVRRGAEKILSRAFQGTDFKNLENRAAGRRNECQAAIQQSVHHLGGWLSWNRDKSWECVGPGLVGRWQVAVILPRAVEKPKWQIVGDVVEGKITLNSNNDVALREGRLLFASPLDR